MKAFEIRKTIAASARDTFHAFENHLILEKWWGPDGFTTISESFDFRPEGVWKFDMHGPDGKAYPNEMMFQEIVVPNRIVMRHSVEPATVQILDKLESLVTSDNLVN